MAENVLSIIQGRIKAPKNRLNVRGKFKYRSAEDILEALKPIATELGCDIILDDEIELIGNRYYVKSTATLTHEGVSFCSTAYAREDESKSGFDGSQLTGTASSYARKSALSGLLALDSAEDSDDLPPEEPNIETVKANLRAAVLAVGAEVAAEMLSGLMKKHKIKNLAAISGVEDASVLISMIDALKPQPKGSV